MLLPSAKQNLTPAIVKAVMCSGKRKNQKWFELSASLYADSRSSNDLKHALDLAIFSFAAPSKLEPPQSIIARSDDQQQGNSTASIVQYIGDEIYDINDLFVLVSSQDGTTGDYRLKLEFTPGLSFYQVDNFTTAFSPPVVADFNGDGISDVALTGYTARSGPNDISIFLGMGDGGLANPTSFAAHGMPQNLAVADVTGDGVLDLITVNFGTLGDDTTEFISVFRGRGDGTFEHLEQAELPLSYVPQFQSSENAFIQTGFDYNEDGYIDVAVAFSQTTSVFMLAGNGDGTFATPLELSFDGEYGYPPDVTPLMTM